MKILYTATVLSHICQFHLPHMKMLQERGCEVHVAAHDNLAVKNGLKLSNCDKFIEIPFSRSPASTDNLRAYRRLRALLNEEHYDVILCNTPMGGIVTRLAAKKARRAGTRVIYMAHGFHFFHGAPKKNWLVFYPIEKLMSRRCDTLITINDEDFALASRKFRRVRVEHIHGVGVRADRYLPVDAARRSELRQAEGLSDRDFVLICTGELNQNKDQKTLIAAAAALREKIPGLRVLLAGNGPLEDDLRAQIASLGLEDCVRLLGYRTDLERVVPACDLVVSCSHREGLPLNIIEAMLCRKPVVASHNRGHNELIAEGKNGFLFDAGDTSALAAAILAVFSDPDAARRMGAAGYEMAQAYTVDAVRSELARIFDLN